MKTNDVATTTTGRQTGDGESRPGTGCQTGQGDSQPDVTVGTTRTTITTTTTTGATLQHDPPLSDALNDAPRRTAATSSTSNGKCRTTASASTSVRRPTTESSEAFPTVSTCPEQSAPMLNASVQNSTTSPQTPAPASQRALTLLSDDAQQSTVKCPAEEAAQRRSTEAEAEAAPSEPDASPGTTRSTPMPEDIPGTTLTRESTQCTTLHSRPEPTAGTRLAPSGEDSAEFDACADTGGTPPKAEVARRNYDAVMQLAKTGYERFHKLPADQITDEHVTESSAGIYGWAHYASILEGRY